MAIRVHGAQRRHVRMLEHERIRIEYLAVVCCNEAQLDSEHKLQNCRKLLIGMIEVIGNYDITPRIMGIQMKPRVLTAFSTYVIAATVSILSRVLVS